MLGTYSQPVIMVQSKIKLGTAAQQLSFATITNREAAQQFLFDTNTMELHMHYANNELTNVNTNLQ